MKIRQSDRPYPSSLKIIYAEVLNVKKSAIKIAENILKFGLTFKDNDYKLIFPDCKKYP